MLTNGRYAPPLGARSMTPKGHEDAFPAAKRNGRCRIRKRSVAADDLGCVNFSVRLLLNWTTPPGLFKK